MNSPTVFDRIWDSPLHDRDDQRLVPGGRMRAGAGCDVRVGADTATLGQPRCDWASYREAAPHSGRAPDRLRQGAQLILSGETLDGVSAYEIGLLDEVVPASSCANARSRSRGRWPTGPVTLAIAKRAVRAASSCRCRPRLDQERDLFALAFATEDGPRSVAAFLERKPEWRRR